MLLSSLPPVIAFSLGVVALSVAPGISSVYASMGSTGHASPNSSHDSKSGHMPLDVGGYPVAPPDLDLEQVHVYIRHGERTPVGVRMADPPASIPEHWMFCHTARHFRAGVASSRPMIPGAPSQPVRQDGEGEEESLRVARVVERADGTIAPGEW